MVAIPPNWGAVMMWSIYTRKGSRKVYEGSYSDCRSWATDVWRYPEFRPVHYSGGYIVTVNNVAMADIIPKEAGTSEIKDTWK